MDKLLYKPEEAAAVLSLSRSTVYELMAARLLRSIKVGRSPGKLLRDDGRTRRPWKARTINLMLLTLGQVLDDAMKQGKVQRNVAALVDRLRQTKRTKQTYTVAEVKSC